MRALLRHNTIEQVGLQGGGGLPCLAACCLGPYLRFSSAISAGCGAAGRFRRLGFGARGRAAVAGDVCEAHGVALRGGAVRLVAAVVVVVALEPVQGAGPGDAGGDRLRLVVERG